MRTSTFARFAVALITGGLLASCALPSQPLPAASAPSATHALASGAHAISSMARGIAQRDLLYVSNGNGTVTVFRYWQHTAVAVLPNFSQPMGECADRYSNVYITDFQTQRISVYPHGGTKPIRVINDSPYYPYACAVDHKTGNLAVANFGADSYSAGNVAIYRHGTGPPLIYTGGSANYGFTACAYDDRGDLLAVSYYGFSSFFFYGYFYYLPKGAAKLIPMNMPGPTKTWSWGEVYGIAWDGSYWLVNYYGVYRYTIGIKAQYVDEISLKGDAYQPIAVYRQTPQSAPLQIVSAVGSRTVSEVNFWNYPSGGYPTFTLKSDVDLPYGVAISLRTQ